MSLLLFVPHLSSAPKERCDALRFSLRHSGNKTPNALLPPLPPPEGKKEEKKETKKKEKMIKKKRNEQREAVCICVCVCVCVRLRMPHGWSAGHYADRAAGRTHRLMATL